MAASKSSYSLPVFDAKYFAKRFASWLGPEILIQSAMRLHADRKKALVPSQIIFGSNLLTPDNDGGLKVLVREFLKWFRIPPETIELLRSLPFPIPDTVWDQFLKYRFKGTILDPEPDQRAFGQTGLYIIQERDAYNDILMRPLQALNTTVADLATTWQRLAKMSAGPPGAFLRHAAPDPGAVWLEARVAAYYGFHVAADPSKQSIGAGSVNFSYRAVTLLGWDPGDDAPVRLCRDAARNQAAETRKPI